MEDGRMAMSKSIGVIATLATIVLVGGARAAEVQKGAMYPFHTPPKDKCPGLDWYAYVDEDSNVTGTVSWAKMKHSAKFEGKIGADGTFLLQAHEVGGP